MSGIRDTYPTWASVPAHIQRAVNAYDDARRQDSPWEWAMSERNKTSIAPMIEAAIEAAKPPPGADSGLAAADDNPQRDVPRDEEGRDAYQIIAEGNRQAMLRRAGVKDRSREPLLGPPSDMLVSRILLEALPDVDPKRADQLAVKINDALPADDNHKALVEALERIERWEMPETGHFWPDDYGKPDPKRPMSYASCFGSLGEKAVVIAIAHQALAAFQSRQEEKQP